MNTWNNPWLLAVLAPVLLALGAFLHRLLAAQHLAAHLHLDAALQAVHVDDQERAALAIAIAPKPRLVVADEPETGLDPVLRRAVVELLVKHGADIEAADMDGCRPLHLAMYHNADARVLEQLELLGDKLPERVLDVGSGPGRASGAMTARARM